MKRILSLSGFLCTALIFANSIIHTVESGETLYGIALKYEVSTKEIISENNLESSNLNIGQKLKIVQLASDIYRVKQGDTLSGIAYHHDITLKHLLLVNRIDSGYKLQIGEELTVPTTPEKKKVYTVKKGDTISWISMTYNIDSEELISINNIKNNRLKIGEILKLTTESSTTSIPVKQAAITIPGDAPKLLKAEEKYEEYTVKSGDTLSGIAWDYQTTIDDIKELNSKELNSIKVGEKLKLPLYAKLREELDYHIYHTVKPGDTLSGISYSYNISLTLLRELNNLQSDIIKVGQKIKLIPQQRVHKVKEGETLWSIAREYEISVDQLMQYNHLNTTLVNVGRELSLYDYNVAKHNNSSISLVAMQYNRDLTEHQPNKNYSVDELKNPLEKYNLAKDLWKNYAKKIEDVSMISEDLNGWTIILDPGHGGKDPGAIATVNLNGRSSYIVEDEYAYDTTVRLYELLKRHGADVYMTILSPDHISRNPEQSTTFINEKNEIYNNYHLNSLNTNRVWPVGGQWGLSQRVEICNNIISTTDDDKTMFISLHADNDLSRGPGKLVLFNQSAGLIDKTSKEFAYMMSQDLGDDAIIKPMSLAVLRGNNADVKVLVELRNMAHLSEAMALLDSETRQNDAQSILNGIKRYVEYFQE